MKYFIFATLLFTATFTRAQITLEHTYPTINNRLAVVEVDSGVWKYVLCEANLDAHDTFYIFNLDHSLNRIISIPWIRPNRNFGGFPLLIAKRLFALDTDYGYLYVVADSTGIAGLRIFTENGITLFSCDSCTVNVNNQTYYPFIDEPLQAIKLTSAGTKMVIKDNRGYEIYSLPGKLPGGQQMLSVGNSQSPQNFESIATSAYPNPSSGRVRIMYDLPPGVQSGDLVLTDVNGRELKRYHITSAFSDLLLDASDLPSGAYFYKVITSNGESAAQKIICE